MQNVSDNDLRQLRKSGLVNPDEIAYIIDDIVIAESLTSGEKRKIKVDGLMLESKRTLLKG